MATKARSAIPVLPGWIGVPLNAMAFFGGLGIAIEVVPLVFRQTGVISGLMVASMFVSCELQWFLDAIKCLQAYLESKADIIGDTE